MKNAHARGTIARRQMLWQHGLLVVAGALCLAATVLSAIAVKEMGARLRPLAAIEAPSHAQAEADAAVWDPTVEGEVALPPSDLSTRWFDGRAVRPARVVWMTVTAYSPDERSCGKFADGYTANLSSVWTNGMRLVAADTRLLPFGSLVSVPGYDGGTIVPVLDRGRAIKGRRLDVLFATHEQALAWGVRRLPVVVWEPAGEDAR